MKKIIKAIILLEIFICIFNVCACSNDDSDDGEGLVAKFNNYTNPISPIVNGKSKSTYQADPYVVRDDDGMYYMYCTQTDVYTPSLAFKRGPIWRSADLCNWEYAGDVFDDYVPDWGASGAGVWAPTVVKVKDKWNYYYSLSTGGDSNPGIGVATSSTPYGPWEHHGKMFLSDEIGVTNSIDPHVFYDGNELYMVFGSYGGLITLVELTEDGIGLKNGIEYQKENKTALAGYKVFDTNNYEGSLIIKKDDFFIHGYVSQRCGINISRRMCTFKELEGTVS